MVPNVAQRVPVDGDHNVDVRGLHIDDGTAWIDEYGRTGAQHESLVGVDLRTAATRRISLGASANLVDLRLAQAFVIDDTVRGSDVTRVVLARVDLVTGATTHWGEEAFAAQIGSVGYNYEPEDARVIDAHDVSVLGRSGDRHAVSRLDPVTGKVRWTTPVGRGEYTADAFAALAGASYVLEEFRGGLLEVDRVGDTGMITARSEFVVPSKEEGTLTMVAGPDGVYIQTITDSKDFDTALLRLDPQTLRPTTELLVANAILGAMQLGPGGVWVNTDSCRPEAWDQWWRLDPVTLAQSGPVRLEPTQSDGEHAYQLDARTPTIWQLDLNGFPEHPMMLRRWAE